MLRDFAGGAGLTVAVALSLGLAPGSAGAQAPDQLYTATKQQLEVTKAVLAQQTAWNKGDLEKFLGFYKDAPDTEAMLASPVRGLANIRSAFHLNYPNRESMGNLEESEVEVRELGATFALATGKYHLARSKKGGGDADGTFTEVLEKTAAGWQVVYSVNT